MPAKILVAEDHADFREMLRVVLSNEGYIVLVAEDGAATLRLVEDDPPDLIITDIQMPNLDGIGLIKRLRERPEWSHIPVFVLSAQDSGNLVEALRAGASESMNKPAQLAPVLQLIKRLLFSDSSIRLLVWTGLAACML